MGSNLPPLSSLVMKEFRPCAFYSEVNDHLYVLERDCSVTSEYVPGSNIELLRENGPGGQLVGVVVNIYSQYARWDTVDAAIKHFPWWFRFLYKQIKAHRIRQIQREMKAAGAFWA